MQEVEIARETASTFHVKPKNEALSQMKDIIAGTVAGVVSKFFDYPIDTLKVLTQLSQLNQTSQALDNNHNNAKSTIKQTSQKAHNTKIQVQPIKIFKQAYSEGGLRRIYRGVSAPMFGASVENLIVFWLFGFAERKIQQFYNKKDLTTLEVGYCGAFGGIGVGLWLTPVEFVKCQMQVSETALKYNNSTFRCFIDNVIRKPSNLFIGLNSTLVREVPGTFVYFLSYRSSVKFWQYMSGNSNQSHDDAKLWMILLSGSTAGLSYWTMIYPVDTIKSKLQTQVMQNLNENTTDNGNNINMTNNGINNSDVGRRKAKARLFPLLMQQIKTFGLRSLWVGWRVVAIKAVLNDACIFGTYETSRKLLDRVID